VLAYETAHARPSNLPAATGAKRSVVLGKITPTGPQNGRSGGAAVNGASHAGSSATHKAKASRATNVTRSSVTPKAKAAAR